MEIHFCDLCNESVPQSDLDEGKAFIRKGRVVCATCDGLMSSPPSPGAAAPQLSSQPPGSAPGSIGAPGATGATGATGAPAPAGGPRAEAVAPAGRSSYGALLAGFLAVGAMLLVAGVTFMVQERLTEAVEDARAGRNALRDSLALEDGRLTDRFEAQREAHASDFRALNENLMNLRSALEVQSAELKGMIQGLDGRIEGLGAKISLLEGYDGRVRDNERELADVANLVAGLQGDARLLAEGLLELENRMAGVRVQEEPAAAGPPPWLALTEDLKSPNSGTRWTAVQALGETRDPAVIKYLVPMLEDVDIFVRMATARILGDLKSPTAIPALINALEDEEPSVREAAVVSLRSLSGRNFKFDPTASDNDRARRVKAWRDWWEKNQDDYLGEGAEAA